MPYRKQSPSKYKYLPGWLRRQQQSPVDKRGRQIVGGNFSVPRGAKQ